MLALIPTCHTPIFPRITGGPGGEYRDVVDIIIVKQHNLKCTAEAKDEYITIRYKVISKYYKRKVKDPQADQR